MKTLNFNQDQFANWMFDQNKHIKNYNFDLFYDISKITDFYRDSNNYRDEYGQIITDKPVKKDFLFFIRETGSYLIDPNLKDGITEQDLDKTFEHLFKYKITIVGNYSYLSGINFATIEQIK